MDDWNRSDEWEVQKTRHDRARIRVTINEHERVAQMIRLRDIIPYFRLLTPAQVRDRIDENHHIDLDGMEGREARAIRKQLADAGIEAEQIDVSFVSFLPFNRTNSFAWLIENPAESKRIAEKMMSEGVPVVEVEA